MNDKDIIQLALEHFGAVLKPPDLEVKLAVLAVAAEREACAKICDVQIESGALSELEKYRAGFIADVIRARGEMK